MTESQDSIVKDVGFSTLYEPREPKVDIIFVHGIQGHPFATWALSNKSAGKRKEEKKKKAGNKRLGPFDSIKRHFVDSRRKTKETQATSGAEVGSHNNASPHNDAPSDDGDSTKCFWPRDLLPIECKSARILTWGYDSKVTKYYSGPVNKSSIFQHGKDLLFALGRERELNRPIIWVAHSLGGIIVKQALAEAHTARNEDERELHNIVSSTKAMVFFGTPHRGSGVADAGQVARKVAESILRMDTNDSILDALGLRTTDLERCQDAFSRCWIEYKIRVKTFQESCGLTSVNLGMASEKVVPDFSSSLGDAREHAETLEGNHMDMCRMKKSDSNWKKVSGELRDLCGVAENSSAKRQTGGGMSDSEKGCLLSLFSPEANAQKDAIPPPFENTATWIQQDARYKAWRHRERSDKNKGLLWIKGKPGSGKSTTMKAMVKQVAAENSARHILTTAFFFSAKGALLQRTSLGLYHSLVHQLVYADRGLRDMLLPQWVEKVQNASGGYSQAVPGCLWQKAELKSFLQDVYRRKGTPPTVIFVDAVDECQDSYETDVISKEARETVSFLQDLQKSAYDNDVILDICLSSRTSFTVGTKPAYEIVLDQCNQADLETFVKARLVTEEVQDRDILLKLGDAIVEKSSGIFLWAKLVVDILLDDMDGGRNLTYLWGRLKSLPRDLENIYREMLTTRTESDEDRKLIVSFFQWIVFSFRPLSLREWHHILGMIQSPPPRSLRQWKESKECPNSNDALEKRIKRISRGLVEVRSDTESENLYADYADGDSIKAGAGSLDLNLGETRIVQVIHDSVREFFRRDGFAEFGLTGSEAIVAGHSTILKTCLDYLRINDLDALVKARRCNVRLSSKSVSDGDSPGIYRRDSVASFSSASSSGSGRKPQFPRKFSTVDSRGSIGSAGSNGPFESLKLGITEDNGPNTLERFLSDSKTHLTTTRLDPESVAGLWLEENLNHFGGVRCPNGSETSVKSQVLGHGDVLGLSDYSLHEVFAHAVDLQSQNAALDWVAQEFLLSTSTPSYRGLESGLSINIWERYVLLRDDLKPNTTFIQFCLENRLHSLIVPALELKSPKESVIDTYSKVCDYYEEAAKSMVLYQMNVMSGKIESDMAWQWKGLLSNIIRTGESKFYDWRCLCKVLWHEGQISNDDIEKAIRIPDSEGIRPLSVCCMQKSPRIVEILLDMGADPNEASQGQRPLEDICLTRLGKEDLDIMSVLLNRGASANSLDDKSNTPLHRICNRSDPKVDAIRLLLEHGGDPSITNASAETPLHILCSPREKTDDFHGALIALLRHDAKVNAQDETGSTPLHNLCRGTGLSRTASIKLLFAHGCDPNIKDQGGRTPFHDLCSNGAEFDVSIIHLFYLHGAVLDIQDGTGATPIYLATVTACTKTLGTRKGYLRVAEERFERVIVLASLGANISIPDSLGINPLFIVCKREHPEARKPRELYLEQAQTILGIGLSLGADDLHASDKHGKTALHYAGQNANADLVELFLQAGAEANIQDTEGNTPLHIVAMEWSLQNPLAEGLKCTRALKQAGADFGSMNAAGKTPLEIIRQRTRGIRL